MDTDLSKESLKKANKIQIGEGTALSPWRWTPNPLKDYILSPLHTPKKGEPLFPLLKSFSTLVLFSSPEVRL